jgi:hypothetical protein
VKTPATYEGRIFLIFRYRIHPRSTAKGKLTASIM